AVAAAAAKSGVARKPIDDVEGYRDRLAGLLSRSYSFMQVIHEKAKSNPKRVVMAEGDNPKIQRAAKILAEEGIAHPILLSRDKKAEEALRNLEVTAHVEVVDPEEHPKFQKYVEAFWQKRARQGVTREDAFHMVRVRNFFAGMMVAEGDADVALSGLTTYYPETIRPALLTIGVAPGTKKVSGLYILILQDRVFFFADTTVNINPSSEDLAEIAIQSADTAKLFNITPRVAMIAFSNFGSTRSPETDKVREAVRIVHKRRPDLECDGEMQADTAVLPEFLRENYPWSTLTGPPNVLVFPELQSANAAYKLVWRLGKAEAIGPILMGMGKPVHVLQRGVEVADIVNMAAFGVVDAQARKK
ncbi:MAG TPA: phosphate acyltransferase, partial [Thermoanaerobaculia bacterium]|nr:phosphate acyltransferase [Thermoanaerobaculia bacterium]